MEETLELLLTDPEKPYEFTKDWIIEEITKHNKQNNDGERKERGNKRTTEYNRQIE